MATPSKPYLEFGLCLQKWREARFRSALEFFREKDVPIQLSYRSYVDFEKGVALPAPEVVVQLARYFQQDPKPAVFLWAKVQMPTPELRAAFDMTTAQAQGVPFERRKADRKESSENPNFENTWVFGLAELKVLTRTPWLWDLCSVLVTHFPNEVKFSSLKFPDEVTAQELCKKLIKDWIENGYIEATKTGLKINYQHLQIPKTEAWNQVRRENAQRAFHDVQDQTTQAQWDAQTAYRTLIHRSMTQEQAKRWVAEIKRLEAELRGDSYAAENSKNQNYAFLGLLGPRKILG